MGFARLAVHFVDYRPFRKRPLLCSADFDGRNNVCPTKNYHAECVKRQSVYGNDEVDARFYDSVILELPRRAYALLVCK